MGTLAFKNFMIAGQTQDERRPVMNLVGRILAKSCGLVSPPNRVQFF